MPTPENLTLVGALAIGIAFLSKILLDYISDIKAARDLWRTQAQESTSNLRDLTEAILVLAPQLRTQLGSESTAARGRRKAGNPDA